MTAMRGVSVTVQGDPLPDNVMRRLTGVRVAARLNQPAQCELSFAAAPGSGAETQAFRLGAAIAVKVTDEDDALFEGELTAFEVEYAGDGSAGLRARAYDPLHRLRKHQELRVFESVTAADLAGQLAGAAGLDVDADEDGPRIERLLQHRHTDFDLLLEVAGRAGLHLAVEGSKLHLITLDGYGLPVPLELGRSVHGLRIEANLDQAAGESAALGWHPQRAELIEEKTGDARSGRKIQLRPDPADVGADGTRTAVDQPGRSDDELAAIAQARLDARVAALVTVSGDAEGDPDLRPGRRIALAGCAEQLAGVYVLTEVVHTIDAAGFLSRFSTQPPAVATPLPTATVTLGKVTDVDDPDRLGRVRVDLPAYGGLDAGWLGVVFPGAGRGKGIIALPDPEDTVFVVLPGGEPAAGIVIGSLYGTVEPYDAGIDSGKSQRWSMRTANGQAFVIDDGGRQMRLQNDAGSFVELTPDLMTLHAATDLVLEAPGKAMQIRANTVDFQQATAPEQDGAKSWAAKLAGGS
jgi:phage protein D/phage baseplate assembly protein gpV